MSYHKHKCHFCGYVWDHHDVNDVRHGDSGAHECPDCGRCNWSLGVYDGPEESRSRNGIDPGPAVTAVAPHPDQRERP